MKIIGVLEKGVNVQLSSAEMRSISNMLNTCISYIYEKKTLGITEIIIGDINIILDGFLKSISRYKGEDDFVHKFSLSDAHTIRDVTSELFLHRWDQLTWKKKGFSLQEVDEVNVFFRNSLDRMVEREFSTQLSKKARTVNKFLKSESSKLNLDKNRMAKIDVKCCLQLEDFQFAMRLFHIPSHNRKIWTGIQIAFMDRGEQLVYESHSDIVSNFDIILFISYFLESIKVLEPMCNFKDESDFNSYLYSLNAESVKQLMSVKIAFSKKEREDFLSLCFEIKDLENKNYNNTDDNLYCFRSEATLDNIHSFINSVKEYLILSYI